MIIVDEDGVVTLPAVSVPFVRTAYNYDRDVASFQSGLVCCAEEDKTQQSFAEEVDINTIVRNFGLTGELPDDVRMPQYGDFTGVSDYQEAMNSVREADEAFMLLPAELRYKFANDPQRLLEFVADGGNREEAQKLGLLKVEVPMVRDAIVAIDEMRVALTPKVV